MTAKRATIPRTAQSAVRRLHQAAAAADPDAVYRLGTELLIAKQTAEQLDNPDQNLDLPGRCLLQQQLLTATSIIHSNVRWTDTPAASTVNPGANGETPPAAFSEVDSELEDMREELYGEHPNMHSATV